MRFLADQDVYRPTVVWLRSEGHDVVTASEIGSARASDEELLEQAHGDNRALVTRDKDFGALVFLRIRACSGVILLRMAPSTVADVHEELGRLLREHSQDEIREHFIVVEPGRHRIRQLPQRG